MRSAKDVSTAAAAAEVPETAAVSTPQESTANRRRQSIRPCRHRRCRNTRRRTGAVLSIPSRAFYRLVAPHFRQLCKEKKIHFRSEAIYAVQRLTEAYLEGRFRQAYFLAYHAGRKTVRASDWRLVEALRGNPHLI